MRKMELAILLETYQRVNNPKIVDQIANPRGGATPVTLSF